MLCWLKFYNCLTHGVWIISLSVRTISPMHVFRNWEISNFFLPQYFLIEYTYSMRLCLQSSSVSRACCISCLLRRTNVPMVRCSFSGFWNMVGSIPLSYKNILHIDNAFTLLWSLIWLLLNTPGTSKHVYKVNQKILTTWQHFHVISCFGFINFCSIGPLK